VGRMPDPRIAGYPTDVEMIWDEKDPGQWIDLKIDPKGYEDTGKALGIPTSKFANPSNERFAWGTIGLVGCTVYAVVKTPTAQDPTPAVYFAHIWE
jgi:hypothetical protein